MKTWRFGSWLLQWLTPGNNIDPGGAGGSRCCDRIRGASCCVCKRSEFGVANGRWFQPSSLRALLVYIYIYITYFLPIYLCVCVSICFDHIWLVLSWNVRPSVQKRLRATSCRETMSLASGMWHVFYFAELWLRPRAIRSVMCWHGARLTFQTFEWTLLVQLELLDSNPRSAPTWAHLCFYRGLLPYLSLNL